MEYKPSYLAAIFGWDIAKQVKSHAEKVRLSDWLQTENILSGKVELTAGNVHTCQLTLLKPTLAEGKCSCPIFRREHKLCVHLGLLYWKACGKIIRLEESSQEESPIAPDVSDHEEEIYYQVSFPKNWKEILMGKTFPVLIKKIDPASAHCPEEQKIPLGHWLSSIGGDKDKPFLRLALPASKLRESFFTLLKNKVIFLDGGGTLRVEECPPALPVKIHWDGKQCLFIPTESHFFKGKDLGSVYVDEQQGVLYAKHADSELIRSVWLPLMQRTSVSFSLKEAVAYLSRGQDLFYIENREELDFFVGEEKNPSFFVEYRGHGERLSLYAFARYTGENREFPLMPQASYGELHFQEGRDGSYLWRRHEGKERRFILSLEDSGFVFTPQGWMMEGSDSIHLFGLTLHEEWIKRGDVELKIDAYWARLLAEGELLTPRMVSRQQGEDWLSAAFVFESASGKQYPARDLLKQIHAGKRKVKLKSGKNAFWDPKLAEDWTQLMQESDLTPSSPDEYKLSSRDQNLFEKLNGRPFSSSQGSSESGIISSIEKVLSQSSLVPHHYQKEGIHWAVEVLTKGQGALLGDDMGLGKTMQAMLTWAALRDFDHSMTQGPLLIVTPASLLFSWQEEFSKCLPSVKTTVLHGSGREELVDGEVFITTYALMYRDFARHRRAGYAMMIFDEASLLRNPDTDAAEAARRIPARYKLALSGTPIENSVRDLWSLFEVVLPGYLGKRSDFQMRYEKPLAQTPPDTSLMHRLRMKISPWLLRRTKKEVAPELPSKTTTLIPIELSADEQSLYQSVLREGVQQIETLKSEERKRSGQMLMLTTLLRLRQICNASRLILPEDKAPQSSAKMEALLLLLKSLKENGHKTLVFSQFSSMLHLIQDQLNQNEMASLMIEGATKDRQSVVKKFREDDKIPVLLMSLKAGGYGLNLQEADTVIHVDPWWNPAVEAQATDRVYRLGQTKPVQVYKLITRNTVEEKILSLQKKKSHVMELGLSDEAPMMQGLTEQDLMDLLEV